MNTYIVLLQRLKKFIQHYSLAANASLAIFLITAIAYKEAVNTIHDRQKEQFEYKTDQAYNAIKNRIDDYSQLLNGAKGLFSASGPVVTRASWKAYIKELHMKKKYPGSIGIGYAQIILPDQLKTHVQQMRSEGLADYQIWPKGKRSQYVPIIYLEPNEENNRNLFGFDMYSEKVRSQAMDLATITKQLTLSARVKLISDTSTHYPPGFLMYIPVYKKGAEPNTTSECRKSIQGFVFFPYRAEDLMNAVLSKEYNSLDIEIFEGDSALKESLIFNKNDRLDFSNKDPGTQHKSSKLVIGNQAWTLYFTAPSSDSYQALLIALGGSIIGVLLFIVISFFSHSRIQTIALAKKMTYSLRESEEQIKNIFNNAPDAVIVINKEGRILRWNPKAEAIFGWQAQEIIGQTLTSTIIPPQYREAHERGMKRFLATGEGNVLNKTIEITALNKKNKEFDIELSISNTNEHGSPIFIAFISDITQRKQAQLTIEQKTKELERSNSELQQFASVASHDLKEPLRKIRLFGDLLYSEYKDQLDENGQDYVLRIQNSATRMQSLIEDLLTFSKIGSQNEYLEPVDLNVILKDILIDLEVSIQQKNAKIVIENMPTIQAIPNQMRQLFQNLISNALKFTAPEVVPEIRISSRIIDGPMIQDAKRLSKEKFHEISVTDNGIGFDKQYAEKIFIIFQRLHSKEAYDGTGIGLAICKKIVEFHNGSIIAKSKLGIGSSFIITLPVS